MAISRNVGKLSNCSIGTVSAKTMTCLVCLVTPADGVITINAIMTFCSQTSAAAPPTQAEDTSRRACDEIPAASSLATSTPYVMYAVQRPSSNEFVVILPATSTAISGLTEVRNVYTASPERGPIFLQLYISPFTGFQSVYCNVLPTLSNKYVHFSQQ